MILNVAILILSKYTIILSRQKVYAFHHQLFMLLCIDFRVRKKLDKNVYTPVDPCREGVAQ